MYQIFHELAIKKKKWLPQIFFFKVRHHTDFEADLWPETGTFFFFFFFWGGGPQGFEMNERLGANAMLQQNDA